MSKVLQNALLEHSAKPAFNAGPLSTRQRKAFRWRTDDGPLLVVFGSSLPSLARQKTRKKTLSELSWTPLTILSNEPRSAVGNVSGYRWASESRSRGQRSHTFVGIDHEIISTVILLHSTESFEKGGCQLQVKAFAQSTG